MRPRRKYKRSRDFNDLSLAIWAGERGNPDRATRMVRLDETSAYGTIMARGRSVSISSAGPFCPSGSSDGKYRRDRFSREAFSNPGHLVDNRRLFHTLFRQRAEEVGHGQHADDGAVGRNGQMADALLLHEGHRF